MKRKHLKTLLEGVFLSMLVTVCALGCLKTGFALEVERPGLVFAVWLLAACFGAAAFSLKRGGILVAGALAFFCGYLWHRGGDALEQSRGLLQQISRRYDLAYGWGALRFSPVQNQADWPLGMLGCFTALATSWNVCRGKDLSAVLAVVLLPLGLCCVIIDTPPQAGYLLGLLGGVFLLLLTRELRRENPMLATDLTLRAAIPLVLVLTALGLGLPKDGYVNQVEDLREKLLALAEQRPDRFDTALKELFTPAPSQEAAQEAVNLTTLGRRVEWDTPVMEVTAQRSGSLYLRGRDYDSYNGLGWEATAHRAEEFGLDGEDVGTVRIKTRRREDVYYVPYYPQGTELLAGGLLQNTGQRTQYVFRQVLPPQLPQTGEPGLELPAADSAAPDMSRYLSLPEDTLARAREWLGPVSGTNTQKAELIRAVVRSSAEYDLDPGRMPNWETDFALWFLEDCDRGYCVHFATAATVLLRSAGVPARYVTGYLVEAEAGTAVTVTDKEAHAWAEYYEPQLGAWIPLEATPSQTPSLSQPEPSEALPTEAPEQTQAPEATTSPTSPREPQAPEKKEAASLRWLWLLVLPLALEGQRRLRLAYFAPRSKGNAGALERWRLAERLCRRLGEEPPEDLRVLAEKARYSQHSLTAGELRRFDRFLITARGRLKGEPWYKKWISRYVFAVI